MHIQMQEYLILEIERFSHFNFVYDSTIAFLFF